MNHGPARFIRFRSAANDGRLPFGERQELAGIHRRHLALAIDQHHDGFRLQRLFFAFAEGAIIVVTHMSACFHLHSRIDQQEHGGLRGPFQILETDLPHEGDFSGFRIAFVIVNDADRAGRLVGQQKLPSELRMLGAARAGPKQPRRNHRYHRPSFHSKSSPKRFGILISSAGWQANIEQAKCASKGMPRNGGIALTKQLKTLDVSSRQAWRAWLEKNHATESEIWLVFHKRHTGKPSIALSDAIDEALCFGWIDSLIKRLDGDRYARKFTPRKADSKWSTINRRRYAQLKADGLLAAAGLARKPTNRSGDAPQVGAVPRYIKKALQANPRAWAQFEKLPPSLRRNCLAWIASAKKDETRQKRLREIIKRLAAGERPGLM
jgi:uncharacterized protein YdeI (YjbR/CyaY-like superfamily)